MPVLFCQLPLIAVGEYRRDAANAHLFVSAPTVLHAQRHHPGNVRVLRRTTGVDHNCFVLSGKLADVCQALEHMASEELRRATH